MKIVSLLFLSLLFSSLSYTDQRAEENIAKLIRELAQMAPIAQTCILFLNYEMADTPVQTANCNRVIGDFNYLLQELCRMQDNLHQEHQVKK